MTESEFCKLFTNYNGEEIDCTEQLVSKTFTGEELYEFADFIFNKGKQEAENNTEDFFLSLDKGDEGNTYDKHQLIYLYGKWLETK